MSLALYAVDRKSTIFPGCPDVHVFVCVCGRLSIHLYVSRINGEALMKLVTVNRQKVQMKLMTLRGAEFQRPLRNVVNAVAPESAKGFQPNLRKIFPSVGPRSE